MGEVAHKPLSVSVCVCSMERLAILTGCQGSVNFQQACQRAGQDEDSEEQEVSSFSH